MPLSRRIRGLAGTAITWGGIGMVVGIGGFVAVFRPWPLSAIRWQRTLTLFATWEAASLLWGVACGLTFGLVFLALERTRRLSQLSTARITAWGAIAGALFPALLSVRPLLSGASATYFGLIIGASALAGAAWARTSFAMARRLPDDTQPEILPREEAVMGNISTSARDRAI